MKQEDFLTIGELFSKRNCAIGNLMNLRDWKGNYDFLRVLADGLNENRVKENTISRLAKKNKEKIMQFINELIEEECICLSKQIDECDKRIEKINIDFGGEGDNNS